MPRAISRFAGGPTRRVFLAAACLTLLAPPSDALSLRDSTFVTDGVVHTMASTGSTLFVGGAFAHIGPYVGEAAILDAANPVPTFPTLRLPNRANTQVTCAASDSAGGWFLGGAFVEAQGQPHVGLLHVRADGTVANWAPAPNGTVNALAFVGGRLYAAGLFTNIGGQARAGLAAIDTGTALALPWNPVPGPGTLKNFVLAGGKLYLYGSFRSIDGEGRASIAAFDPSTGVLLPDVPSGPDRQSSGSLNAVAASPDRLFLAGDFASLSPPTGALACFDSLTGAATPPYADLTGTVRTTLPDGAGGWFVGGSLTLARGVACRNLVHVTANGSITGFAPLLNGDVLALALCGDTLFAGGAFTTCDGLARGHLAAWRVSTGTLLTAPPATDNVVNSLLRNGDMLLVGGRFTTMGGAARAGLAALDWRSQQLSAAQPWGCGAGVDAMVAMDSVVYVGGVIGTITPVGSGFTRTDTAGVSTDPTPLGITGTGYALAEDGAGGWFVGGAFNTAATSTLNLTQRHADGSLGSFAPALNGTVRALLRAGNTLYVGGAFTTVNGSPRAGLAAFDVVTGALLPFDAALSTSGSVRALALTHDTLYVGGAFTSVGGQPRTCLAIVNATTGAPLDWAPVLSRAPNPTEVQKIVLANGLVWIAGLFSSVSGLSHNCVAALDPVTAAPTAWAPDVFAGLDCTLEVSGSRVYVGGDFLTVNGASAPYLAVLDATTGVHLPGWTTRPSGEVYMLKLVGSTLRVGGSFTLIGGLPRNFAAELDATTGAVRSYSPPVNGFVNAFERSGDQIALAGGFQPDSPRLVHNLVGFDLRTLRPTSCAPNVDGEVTCLAAADGSIYVGGSFATINSLSRFRVGAVDVNGATTSWTSNSGVLVNALAVQGSRLYVGGENAGTGKGNVRATLRTTGATLWNSSPLAPVYTLSGATALLAGGSFGGYGGGAHNLLGSISLSTGLPTSWSPIINTAPLTLAWTNGTLFAGGTHTTISSVSHRYLSAWNTTTNALVAFDPIPDGKVYTLAVSNDTLWAGGEFYNIAGAPRLKLAAFSTTTLALLGLTADTDGAVTTLATARGKLVVAGPFNSTGMAARGGVAAVDARTGFTRAWDPRTTGTVRQLHLLGGRVYAMGFFSRAEAPARNFAAAFDTATAEVAPWAPEPDGIVYSFVPRGGSFYVGGLFSSIGGAARATLAQVDTATGAATAWNPGTNGTPIRLELDSDTLFVGGAFTTAGGQPRGNAASFVAATGALTPWNPAANNQVTSFAFRPGQVFVGGAFTSIGGAPRYKLALLDRSNGLATSWVGNISTSAGAEVDVLDLHNGMLFVGGTFYLGASLTRRNLVALDANTAQPLNWEPDPSQQVTMLLRDRGTLHVGGYFPAISGLAHPCHAALLDPSYQIELLDAPEEAGQVAFALSVPTPNPARGGQRIAFTLPGAGRVRLALHDVHGRRVVSVFAGATLAAGRHEQVIDLSGLAPGLYWYRLEFGGHTRVRSVTLLP